ncbi:heme exporter protein CcmB [Leptospira sp. GIMC2001]|uniref:heme exporter protein CcmB n=1 Tax=Leptospira sp. GIMC2001 TaxID=1513297 RepID=UPI00234AB23E|nr:heme exporter protein CcmB [Leptospira sp. GIMC2001]WCL51123.1 heme exporter protein CcmB [Leptospira sp. GIMC2001]
MFLTILNKEIKLISRSTSGFISMAVLAFTILFIFYFSIEKNQILIPTSLAGIKWAIVFIVSFVLIGQSSWEERETGAHRITKLFVSNWILFMVKSFAVWLMLIVIEILLVFAMVLFFQNSKMENILAQLMFIIPGSLSLSFLGVSLANISNASRMKEIILPLLMVPFSIPLFLYGLNSEYKYLKNPETLISSIFLLIFFCFFYGGIGALFQEVLSEDMDG